MRSYQFLFFSIAVTISSSFTSIPQSTFEDFTIIELEGKPPFAAGICPNGSTIAMSDQINTLSVIDCDKGNQKILDLSILGQATLQQIIWNKVGLVLTSLSKGQILFVSDGLRLLNISIHESKSRFQDLTIVTKQQYMYLAMLNEENQIKQYQLIDLNLTQIHNDYRTKQKIKKIVYTIDRNYICNVNLENEVICWNSSKPEMIYLNLTIIARNETSKIVAIACPVEEYADESTLIGVVDSEGILNEISLKQKNIKRRVNVSSLIDTKQARVLMRYCYNHTIVIASNTSSDVIILDHNGNFYKLSLPQDAVGVHTLQCASKVIMALDSRGRLAISHFTGDDDSQHFSPMAIILSVIGASLVIGGIFTAFMFCKNRKKARLLQNVEISADGSSEEDKKYRLISHESSIKNQMKINQSI